MQKVTKLTQDALRKALLATPEGSTVIHLAFMLNEDEQAVQNMLRRTYGCYVAGFKNSPATGAQQAVWCCVVVPANAKRPSGEWKDPEQRKAYMKAYHQKRKARGFVEKKRTRKVAAKVPAQVAAAPAPQQQGAGYQPKTVWVQL